MRRCSKTREDFLRIGNPPKAFLSSDRFHSSQRPKTDKLFAATLTFQPVNYKWKKNGCITEGILLEANLLAVFLLEYNDPLNSLNSKQLK